MKRKNNQYTREVLSLNRGWLFYEGDFENASIDNHQRAYMQAKTRSTEGVVSQNFDDTKWEKITVPHDFSILKTPDEHSPTPMGCRKRGIAWYRRHFRLEEADRGKNIELKFDGILSFAEVYFNGAPVYSNKCGYTSFSCDVTPMAEYGDFLNTIVIKADASLSEGWWYEGAGIYRDIWLIKRNPVHFATDGVWANPVWDARKKQWHIPVETEIRNTGREGAKVYTELTVSTSKGEVIAQAQGRAVKAEIFTPAVSRFDVVIEKPVKLWDIDSPVLYEVEAKLFASDGTLLDKVHQRCGFRTIAFDADKGFFLNGKNVKLQGTCNHQDHGAIGAAMPQSVERFRIQKLKEMGCNAYRCAHHPPSSSLLDICDELGMLVMDENRHFSTAEVYLGQLEWLVRRDRNHPSVILWSLFNEEPLQGMPVGYEQARKMHAIVKRLDPTRFTTGAMNGGFLTDLNASHAMDVTGINYFIFDYDKYRALAPKHPVLSSEDTSAVSLRGEVATDEKAHTLVDNDTEKVPWGATQREAWKAINERPWMAGGFAWTGFDYHGEPTPYNYWPSNVSFFGIMDICGFPKNAYYVRQAFWRHDIPVLKIATHWNLKLKKGTPVKVMVISNAAKVELFLNGKSLGRQKADKYEMNCFEVPFESGELRAVSYDGKGRKLAETSELTTGKAAALVLEPSRTTIAGDDYDTIPVNCYAVDAAGHRVPNAMNEVTFTLKGEGCIPGSANGDSNDVTSSALPVRKLFNGCAQVMVRAAVGSVGKKLVLQAKASGLRSAEVEFNTIADDSRVYADAPERFHTCENWLRSGFSDERPDPGIELKTDDMNSWERCTPGPTCKWTAGPGKFVMFRTDVSAITAAKKTKTVLLQGVIGNATCSIGPDWIAGKQAFEEGNLRIQIPANAKGNSLTIIVQAGKDGIVGLTGPAVIEN